VIDVRRYKLNQPAPLKFPRGGYILQAKAISLHQLQVAELGADGAATMARELSTALVVDITAGELLRTLTPRELQSMHTSWAREIQRWAWAPAEQLCQWFRRSVNDCPEVTIDGSIAANTAGPGEYFDLPIPEITPAQLVWYVGLKSAYEEFFQGKQKMVTRMWLNRAEPREERERWRMND
jgi:hypothetical protein